MSRYVFLFFSDVVKNDGLRSNEGFGIHDTPFSSISYIHHVFHQKIAPCLSISCAFSSFFGFMKTFVRFYEKLSRKVVRTKLFTTKKAIVYLK